jgi:hypothetical protein
MTLFASPSNRRARLSEFLFAVWNLEQTSKTSPLAADNEPNASDSSCFLLPNLGQVVTAATGSIVTIGRARQATATNQRTKGTDRDREIEISFLKLAARCHLGTHELRLPQRLE